MVGARTPDWSRTSVRRAPRSRRTWSQPAVSSGSARTMGSMAESCGSPMAPPTARAWRWTSGPARRSSNPRWMTGTYGGDCAGSPRTMASTAESSGRGKRRAARPMRQDLRPTGGRRPGRRPRDLIESNGSIVFQRRRRRPRPRAVVVRVVRRRPPGPARRPARAPPARPRGPHLVDRGPLAEPVLLTADDGAHGREPSRTDAGRASTWPAPGRPGLPGIRRLALRRGSTAEGGRQRMVAAGRHEDRCPSPATSRVRVRQAPARPPS